MEELYLDADGVRLHAKLERPEGLERSDLCILLHGVTGHMEERHIRAVAAAMLSVGVAVLRVELFGHGKSDGRFSDHTILTWVDEVLVVIDYAKSLPWVERLVCAGHSQGGYTTMLVAGLRPHDLAALVLLSPAIVIEDGARAGRLFRMTFDPDHLPDLVRRAPDLGEERAFGADYFRVAQTLHVDEAIGRYGGPVLLVHGDQDATVPVRYSVDAAAAYADARLVVVAGDDHGYHAHLDQVTRAVADFLRAL